jgi:hypothetical protein
MLPQYSDMSPMTRPGQLPTAGQLRLDEVDGLDEDTLTAIFYREARPLPPKFKLHRNPIPR